MCGALVGGRFLLEKPAASGGSGTVWTARDVQTGGQVALKMLAMQGPSAVERFSREVRLLSSLDHPGIARYVGHGATPDGTLYVATEWIEGRTLAERVESSALTVDEAVVLGRTVGDALAAVHASGVVHRDIKPRNLLLEGDRVEGVKILDFGIARSHESRTITATGAIIGTPGYMAPEQVRGEATDARADVFSLGCVLFRVLAGAPPFGQGDMVTLLLRSTLDEPPLLHEVRADVPSWLSHVVAGMLKKDRTLRPADGAAVVLALRGASDPLATAPASSAQKPTSLTAHEQRVVSIVVAVASAHGTGEAPGDTPPTSRDADLDLLIASARAAVVPMRARVERLGTSALVVMPPDLGTATDEAITAAQCALALRARLPGNVRLAVATGRGVGDGLPWGAIVDRAAQSVRVASSHVVVDPVTATLLQDRFQLRADAGGLLLLGERDETASGETLDGASSRPLVGRRRELATLQLVARGTFTALEASVAVVIAPAGVGKSRLAAELTATLSREASLIVWHGRGDPVLAGVPFGVLAGMLRGAAGVSAADGAAEVLHKLTAFASRLAPAPAAQSIAAQLGRVLLAASLRGAPEVARYGDSVAAGDRIRLAWTELLSAACAAGPVLLVLDDAHHADRTTIDYIGHALRLLSGTPLFVLVLARPEIDDVHPALWSHACITRMMLRGLSRPDAVELCWRILGDRAPETTVEAIVERAAGNAFFLEELARHSGDGAAADAPESVLAVLMSRLRRLDPLERRSLRAASLFGERFQASDVAALVDVSPALVHATLGRLVERDVLVGGDPVTTPGAAVFAFRHSLLREAANAMLTSADRVLGHRLAAGWLAQKSAVPAHVIAEHFERGGVRPEAARWYLRAAASALEANDLEGVIALGERAVTLGASGEDLASVRLCQSEAHRWRGENVSMEATAREAMALLPAGCEAWCEAVSLASTARGRLGHDQRAVDLGVSLLAAAGNAPSRAWQRAAGRVATNLNIGGAYDVADALLARIEAAGDRDGDPVIVGAVHEARAERALKTGRPGLAVQLSELVARAYLASDDPRLAARAAISAGIGYRAVGAYERALQWLSDARATCERLGRAPMLAAVDHALVSVFAGLGRHREALASAERAIESYTLSGNKRMEQATRLFLALVLANEDRWEEAADEARAASQPLPGTLGLRAHALAVLARVELVRGHVPRAAACAEEAFSLLTAAGDIEEGAALVHLARAECLSATGAVEAAREVLFEAEKRIRGRAQGIEDPVQRRAFLDRIPEHFTTLQLAEAVRREPDL